MAGKNDKYFQSGVVYHHLDNTITTAEIEQHQIQQSGENASLDSWNHTQFEHQQLQQSVPLNQTWQPEQQQNQVQNGK